MFMFSRKTVGVLLAMTALFGVFTAPAQANPASNVGVAEPRYIHIANSATCPRGYFCAYEGWFATGRGVGFYATETNWGAIPAEFRWINNWAVSGWNAGIPGALDDVWAYPLPNFVNHPSYPAVCTPNGHIYIDWSPLRPESNRWVNNC
jgi:hypothetical protein